MARGAQGTAEQNAASGYGNAQTYNTQLENSNAALQNYLLPQYQNMLANPGYTQAQKNAITTASTGAVGASFGNAQDQAARDAARTGNSAGLASQEDQLAQAKANTMAQTNAQNQEQFANVALQQQNQALSGISGLYGMDTSLLGKALGIPPEYLNAYNQAAGKDSFGQQWLLGAQQAASKLI
jgi:hypothetical protein